MKALSLLLVLLSAVVFAEGGSRLSVGPLELQLPAGWRIASTPQRVEGHGPDGQNLIASYVSLKPGAVLDPSSQVLESARGFARDEMPRLAKKNGNVIRQVTELALADSLFEFSAVSQGKRMFRDYYFLQYLLPWKKGMVYLTIEGFGDAATAASSFEQILATQRWIE